MVLFKKLIGALAVALPAVCGLILYFFAAGCRFLAFVLFGCAGLALVFLLLHKLRRHRPKLGKVLLILLTVITGIGLFISIWAGILIGRAMPGQPDRACQYLILLGAGVNGTTPSASLQERIDAAAVYLQQHPQVQCILSGGQGDGEDISEAECMRRYLVEHGIAADRILLEDQSTSTKENLAFSKTVIEADGGDASRIAIISSAYHLYRAKRMASALGMDAIGVAGSDGYPIYMFGMYLREAAAVAKLWIFGA